MALTLEVKNTEGKKVGSVDLPAEIFDAQTNVPLIHQVVTAQLAAARQGTQKAKNRGETSGSGKKPFKQKGTGRARQGSVLLLCNAVVVQHMQFAHVNISNAHQRK